MLLAAVATEAPSLTLATSLVVAGLILIAAEFFLPTMIIGLFENGRASGRERE